MIKNLLSLLIMIVMMSACNNSKKSSTKVKNPATTPKTSVDFEIAEDDNTTHIPPSQVKHDYIPKKEALTQEMAYKFLNMATFGATPKMVEELRAKGVEAWVNEQLNMPYNPLTESTLRQSMKFAQKLAPQTVEGGTIDEIIANNDTTLPLRREDKWSVLVTSSVVNGILNDPSQLRQRMAYALSQTVIASESVDRFFKYSFQGLAYYYDFLLGHAFGNYKDLLYDVSMTPAMATFLTYNGNRKTYTNERGIMITPDENYGRELMQLFTLGLYDLNIDGIQKAQGKKFFKTYTQNDVNEMSKVFTGLTYPKSLEFGAKRFYADMIHPMVCEEDYHDSSQKHILGKTLPEGQDCKEDIQGALDILMKHQNMAPFISKKLIMRLTKSNPKSSYISRVARVFNDNGYGVKGDLKAVAKTILLDEDIWSDIIKGYGTKIKEPFIAYTGMLRALDQKAMPTILGMDEKFYDNNESKFFMRRDYYKAFAQSPLRSPTVFNFYKDSFVPNSNLFRMYSFSAPELEIQTASYMSKFSERIHDILWDQDINHVYDTHNKATSPEAYFKLPMYERVIVNSAMIYDAMLQAVGGDIMILTTVDNAKREALYRQIVSVVLDSTSMRLLGKRLSDKKRAIYIEAYSKSQNIAIVKNNTEKTVRKKLYQRVITPIIKQIVLSDDYMVQ
jgi:uncharacterized protein (DUF1800 family)